MTAEPTIRVATAKDADELMDLICAHAIYEGEAYDPTGKLEKVRAWLCADPPIFQCLVVETDAGVQGYCVYVKQFDSWYGEPYMLVESLYLKDELRGASIGTKLMRLVFEAAKKERCNCVQVMTPSDNSGAIAFYGKLGGVASSKAWIRFGLPF